MRTARLLTVSQHSLDRGGVCVSQHALGRGCVSQHALGRGDVCPGGCLPRGCLPGGCLPRRCLPRGVVSAQGSVCPGGWQTPPVNRMTDRCKTSNKQLKIEILENSHISWIQDALLLPIIVVLFKLLILFKILVLNCTSWLMKKYFAITCGSLISLSFTTGNHWDTAMNTNFFNKKKRKLRRTKDPICWQWRCAIWKSVMFPMVSSICKPFALDF